MHPTDGAAESGGFVSAAAEVSREQTGEAATDANTLCIKGQLTGHGRAGQLARFEGKGISKIHGNGEVALVIRTELDATDQPTGRLIASGTVSGWKVTANFDQTRDLKPEIERLPTAERTSDRYCRRVERDVCGRVVWSPRPNPGGHHLSGAKGVGGWLSSRIR